MTEDQSVLNVFSTLARAFKSRKSGTNRVGFIIENQKNTSVEWCVESPFNAVKKHLRGVFMMRLGMPSQSQS